MTSFVNFTPSVIQAFNFQATLDGNSYNVVVTWNFWAQRYYVNVYALDGTLVFCMPLIGSPAQILLTALSWSKGQAMATCAAPHGIRIGIPSRRTISNASPAAYNGTFQVLAISPTQFTYPIATDPGPATAFGAESFDTDMAGGYFSSTLVYRAPNSQFEISP